MAADTTTLFFMVNFPYHSEMGYILLHIPDGECFLQLNIFDENAELTSSHRPFRHTGGIWGVHKIAHRIHLYDLQSRLFWFTNMG
tara:strand:+ start:646 stop:900 length:255 start_codon:yes stop_codon:yes gene_type:complete